MNREMGKFLILLVDFMAKAAHAKYRQGKTVEAMFIFDILYKFVE